ncbi:enoyl-CoA hydratase [candidate division KSB3 bacterium]|uniref:Enoyl-CoA hydratase n=1 Tax=candidate division KSB3 bacterium TaxID=2044937 RepID=A0A9D5Q4A1_9BACT|nr:enoyl-CoA hydratase [candidate division KSB3 bacterium]MBD3323504.1 enoyl-CoA hydratase [candidate division KSB3 bacterium]
MCESKNHYVEVSKQDRILLITLNTPPENHLYRGTFLELNACRDQILAPEIEAVIFTGTGYIFSKGASLEEIYAVSQCADLQDLMNDIYDFYQFLYTLDKPVIAAINGHCLGGGLELALACHLRLCSERAHLGLPEVSSGVLPGLGGIHRLMEIVGEGKALEMILLGDIIPAAEALRLNLVNRVFPKKDFMSRVLTFTRTLLMGDTACIREVIRLMRMTRSTADDQHIKAAMEQFIAVVSRKIQKQS